jgi:hypothetical protein
VSAHLAGYHLRRQFFVIALQAAHQVGFGIASLSGNGVDIVNFVFVLCLCCIVIVCLPAVLRCRWHHPSQKPLRLLGIFAADLIADQN